MLKSKDLTFMFLLLWAVLALIYVAFWRSLLILIPMLLLLLLKVYLESKNKEE